MDMQQFNKAKEGRLQKHTKAVRDNQLNVALIILALHGYRVELHYMDEPLAWEALELLEEMEQQDQINIWSCSTTNGGIWTTEQRRQLKTGEVDG